MLLTGSGGNPDWVCSRTELRKPNAANVLVLSELDRVVQARGALHQLLQGLLIGEARKGTAKQLLSRRSNARYEPHVLGRANGRLRS